MEKMYEIAGVNILIRAPFEFDDVERFDVFKVNNNKYDVLCEIEIIKEEHKFNCNYIYKDYEKKIYIENQNIYRVFHRGKKNYSCLVSEVGNTNKFKLYIYEGEEKQFKNIFYIFNVLGIEKILNIKDSLLLHSSFIKYKNNGILFTAPSGFGKSTQASLWEKYEKSAIINGDKSFLRKIDNIWNAYGLPYSGSSNIYVNDNAPIKAIVVLRKGCKNELTKLSHKEAFKLILSETALNTWDKEYMNKSIDLVLDLINEVQVYMLSCLPDKSAVDLLKNELWGNKRGVI